jgi:cytochrome c oxidase cbb3-type subunit 3/ubiquinol-cytochrome c reductase cytochrome c subunit
MIKINRHKKWIVALSSALVFFVFSGATRLQADNAENKTPALGVIEAGAALYEKYCAMCHGSNGEGYLADEASALSNPDFLASAGDDYILQGILRGRPGTPMSAWGKDMGGPLSPEDARTIVSFVRSWQREPSVALSDAPAGGNADHGATVYERWCAACHGKYGAGGKAIKLNNPVFQETASDGFIRYAIETGRRQTPMPAYKNKLSPGEITDLVSYIRTFKTKDALQGPVAVITEDYAEIIRERGILHPGNPPADFSPALIDNRFVPADDVFAAYDAGKSFILIDARPQSDFLRSHITGAVSVPFYDIGGVVGLLPKDLWIITYCVCPHALSGRAADRLKAGGYDKVAILDEGFFFWQQKGFPSESQVN